MKIVCSNSFLIFTGYDREQLNVTLLPEMAKVWPAGASTKMAAQYAQSMRSGKFSKFDYGLRENLEVYGQEEPPEYNLEMVTVPVATYWGLNDFYAPEEVKIYIWYFVHITACKISGYFDKTIRFTFIVQPQKKSGSFTIFLSQEKFSI